MGFIAPKSPEFDVEDWSHRPYAERLHMMCLTWATQGFGAPVAAYLFYVVKLAVYIGGFVAFAAATPGIGGLGAIGDWWATPVVFGKAILWTLLWESLGLGCGSGPLTGRYLPPVGGALHWLRPGTTRMPPWRWVPLTGGDRRSVADVVLYAAFMVLVVRALLTANLTMELVAPIIVVFAVLGLRDKTVFLAGRPEHYLLATAILLFATGGAGTDDTGLEQFWAAEKLVMVGLWLGAATSKLNHHFPSVVAVMLSNNPLLASRHIRHRLYRNYPTDLRPSRAAAVLAHGATVVEYTFPLVLLFSSGGVTTTVALVVMVVFHLAILTSFPLGVPLEWNVFFIYAGLVLFGAHADVPVTAMTSPLLIVLLVGSLVVLPVVGNLRPDKVSFLPSMRYYAGNWATGVWLLRPGMLERIDDTMVTAARTPRRQVERLYGPGVFEGVLGRTQAFRSMHLHGRALNAALPLAVGDLADVADNASGMSLDDYEVVDGELVAGMVLGWNFGDGHLHNEQLLAAVQRACGFSPGDVRCLMLESQPMGSPTLAWRVVDAATGPVVSGTVRATDLLDAQPWEQDTSRVQVVAVAGDAGGAGDAGASDVGKTEHQ
jgi:hypothetical protein